MKKIKCFVEIHKKYKDYPSIWLEEPSKLEKKNLKEFGYKLFEAEIHLIKEVK